MLAPLANRLEKHLAPIPKAAGLPNRKVLTDHPLSTKPLVLDHAKWDALLKRHVHPGGEVGGMKDVNVVDYEALSADPDFDAYLKQLAEVDISALQPAEELALWINAYNALCINHVVRHVRSRPPEPLGSILHLKKDGTPVWDQPAGVVGGQSMSLNAVEHDMLRKRWNEPLVHASIVCASASCPNLRREAFVPDRLGEQMADSFAQWMQNPTKGMLLETPRRVFLSRIFLWFADDFGGFAASRRFVRDHGNVSLDAQRALSSASTATRYFRYDWTINARR